ncbi:MAG: M67 family metallopeptidase [Bacteroidota bacterium]|nr:M67 family metallopeptidase [Bacteroidota bacterium]
MIRIKENLIRQIEKHGEKTYPEECCGIMLGKMNGRIHEIEQIVELENTQEENRRRRFLISPDQYMKAEKIATEKKLELLGFYHSHPDHPAIPSAFDTEHALPWFAYIITSVENGKAVRTTAWQLNETRERFDEQELNVKMSDGVFQPSDS